MKQALTNLLTGPDNSTHDVLRVCGLIGALTALGLQVYVVVKSGSFSIQEFGIGYGALLAAIGAGLGLKVKAEELPPS